MTLDKVWIYFEKCSHKRYLTPKQIEAIKNHEILSEVLSVKSDWEFKEEKDSIEFTGVLDKSFFTSIEIPEGCIQLGSYDELDELDEFANSEWLMILDQITSNKFNKEQYLKDMQYKKF